MVKEVEVLVRVAEVAVKAELEVAEVVAAEGLGMVVERTRSGARDRAGEEEEKVAMVVMVAMAVAEVGGGGLICECADPTSHARHHLRPYAFRLCGRSLYQLLSPRTPLVLAQAAQELQEDRSGATACE